MVLPYICSAVLAFVVSYLAVAVFCRWAGARMLDVPNTRSSHTLPTPRGGGLAIVVAALSGIWIAFPFIHSILSVWQLLAFTFGALLVAGVSWVDDLRSLSTGIRFAVHLAAAVLAVLAFGAWKEIIIPGLGSFNLGWSGWPVTLLWIVGLTNAYNFMDGIDGIAGGQAVVAGLGWTIFGVAAHQPFLSAVGILLAASSLGFLGHNWPPAKIFMGDVGSAFLGYSFAVLPVIAAPFDPRVIFAGILFVWPFIFDAAFTFARRLINRENVFAAHRAHLYQRLVISGLSHQTVTFLYVTLAVIGAGMALAYVMDVHHAGVLILVALILLAIGLLALTFWREHRRNI